MNYILNSAVITSQGVYMYSIKTPEQAKKWLEEKKPMSTIGYQETVDALEAITGYKADVNRMQVKFDVGDQALVFRLTCRLNDPSLKGKMTPEFIRQNCEFGILTRIK